MADFTLPKLGAVPKEPVIAIGVGAAAFIGWRYWQARKSAAADAAAADTTTSDFADGGLPPGVIGAVSPTNSYGDSGSTATGDSTVGPGSFTNNAQWTDYVVTKLQQSNDWSYTDIVTALGNGLAGRPTTDTQQSILRAAIAVGGQPPQGAIVIVSGGNTGLTVAPTGVSVQSVSTNQAVIAFTAVPGAASYRAFRSGVAVAVGSADSSPITISALAPNTSYTVHVTAYTASGMASPDSSAVTVKTAAGAAPAGVTGLHATSVTANQIRLDWNDAPGSRGYDITWTDPKGKVGNATSLTSSYVMINLPKSYRYMIKVRGKADTGSAAPGPWSSAIQVTTHAK